MAHFRHGIFFSKQKYITDLLKETGKKKHAKPASTPIDLILRLGNTDEDAVVDRKMYQHLVGKLIYLSHT